MRVLGQEPLAFDLRRLLQADRLSEHAGHHAADVQVAVIVTRAFERKVDVERAERRVRAPGDGHAHEGDLGTRALGPAAGPVQEGRLPADLWNDDRLAAGDHATRNAFAHLPFGVPAFIGHAGGVLDPQTPRVRVGENHRAADHAVVVVEDLEGPLQAGTRSPPTVRA